MSNKITATWQSGGDNKAYAVYEIVRNDTDFVKMKILKGKGGEFSEWANLYKNKADCLLALPEPPTPTTIIEKVSLSIEETGKPNKISCCDGTLSRTCTYHHKGCCSQHGGVCNSYILYFMYVYGEYK